MIQVEESMSNERGGVGSDFERNESSCQNYFPFVFRALLRCQEIELTRGGILFEYTGDDYL